MDNIKVVPYKIEHVKRIIKYGLNDKRIELDAKSYEDQIDFTVPAMAFTLLADNNPVVSGGDADINLKDLQKELTLHEGVLSSRLLFGMAGAGYARNIDGDYFV